MLKKALYARKELYTLLCAIKLGIYGISGIRAEKMEISMLKKKSKKNLLSVEQQVNRVIDFLESHESPIAMPLNMHKDLDITVERYLFKCYIDYRRANENYLSGNVHQAKKDLKCALVCWAEAYDSAVYDGSNEFTMMLLDKTDNTLDDAIETVFSDECPSRKIDPSGFIDFRMALQTSLD